MRHSIRLLTKQLTHLPTLLTILTCAVTLGQDKPANPEANTATPIDRIKAADGFKVELLYSVPAADQGSWVNLCTDDKGRLLVSDQFGGLYRITPPAIGETIQQADVEPVPADIRAVNGMVWSNGALYVGVNDYEQKLPSGWSERRPDAGYAISYSCRRRC